MDKIEIFNLLKSEKPSCFAEKVIMEDIIIKKGLCPNCGYSFGKQTWKGNIFGYKCKGCGNKFKKEDKWFVFFAYLRLGFR